MKVSIIYDSKTGHTARMAEYIAQGVLSVDNPEAKTFSIDAVDADCVKESSAVIIGTPTYHGYLTARMKQWLETGLSLLDVAGKLGGAYATAGYIHGGGDLAIHAPAGRRHDSLFRRPLPRKTFHPYRPGCHCTGCRFLCRSVPRLRKTHGTAGITNCVKQSESFKTFTP